jgi:hypothetical protein
MKVFPMRGKDCHRKKKITQNQKNTQTNKQTKHGWAVFSKQGIWSCRWETGLVFLYGVQGSMRDQGIGWSRRD